MWCLNDFMFLDQKPALQDSEPVTWFPRSGLERNMDYCFMTPPHKYSQRSVISCLWQIALDKYTYCRAVRFGPKILIFFSQKPISDTIFPPCETTKSKEIISDVLSFFIRHSANNFPTGFWVRTSLFTKQAVTRTALAHCVYSFIQSLGRGGRRVNCLVFTTAFQTA